MKLAELFKLPEVNWGEEKLSTIQPTDPDLSSLTDDQKQIFDEVMEVVNGGKDDDYIYVLKGYAGTGKTFLVSKIMEYLLFHTSLGIAVTAPTNQAVKVLKGKSLFDPNLPNLAYATIHSLLGLREVIDGYGRQTFKRLKDQDLKIDQYNVVFIDESSMLADELFRELINLAPLYQLKYIFIGDPAQIPPVGQNEFELFDDAKLVNYKAKAGMLTEVLRQSLGNPIITLTMKIRQFLGRDNVLPIRTSTYDEGTGDGVHFMDGNDAETFTELLRHYFTSENFQKDPTFVKLLAYRNATVDYFNTKIRKMIYGEEASRSRYCVGEKLLADKPIIEEGSRKVIFTTNDEFEVESIGFGDGDFMGVSFRYYELTVASELGVTKKIKVLHEDSDEDYKLVYDHLVSEAKSVKQGSWEAADRWKKVYALKEVFAEVKYNYALTCHKSQGSTYGNVFVMESDIDVNRKIVERNRIKYTAFTRPVNKLFICY